MVGGDGDEVVGGAVGRVSRERIGTHLRDGEAQ